MCSADVFERMHYLFLLQPRPSSQSGGSEDSLGGRAARTAAAKLARPGRKTGKPTATPAIRMQRKESHQKARHWKRPIGLCKDVFYSCCVWLRGMSAHPSLVKTICKQIIIQKQDENELLCLKTTGPYGNA